MPDLSFLDEFSVLLTDDSLTRLELFEHWLPGIVTQSAASERDVYEHLDSSVAVVFLSQSLLGDGVSPLKKAILNRNPYCQLARILPRRSFVTPLEDSYDVCLRRPIFRDELQSTVEERLKCGVYSATLYEFYRLNAELAGTERFHGTDEHGPSPHPDWKHERYRELRTRLDLLQPTLDIDDVHSILRSIELHKQWLTEPEMDADTAGGSKYHPERCPKCKLQWGVDHRNDLGRGFERVGAYVWRCARCTNLVHGPGASHRRVAWR